MENKEKNTNWLENFPVLFFTVIMGYSGLTLALQVAGEVYLSEIALLITTCLFLLILLIYIIKITVYRDAVIHEWQHPIKISFFPAISISILLLSLIYKTFSTEIATILWLVGIAAQVLLALSVLANWIGNRPYEAIHISPAWFIPTVGNIIAAVGGVELGFTQISWILFSAGVIFWILLLTLVFNRLIFHNPLPERMVPTLAILVAPPAVTFLAWVKFNGGNVDNMAHAMYGASLAFLALTLTQARLLIRLAFSLSWWALSFPFAALVSATMIYGTALDSQLHLLLGRAGVFLLFLLILGLSLRTMLALFRKEICIPD
ncbi:C4-dicarboxylate ABC transporter [Rhodobacterales bacterium LSUCC0387]|nr:C4-dicarboxylate ABC transporter [Rhodobacterales bacterium LSUCC0387]